MLYSSWVIREIIMKTVIITLKSSIITWWWLIYVQFGWTEGCPDCWYNMIPGHVCEYFQKRFALSLSELSRVPPSLICVASSQSAEPEQNKKRKRLIPSSAGMSIFCPWTLELLLFWLSDSGTYTWSSHFLLSDLVAPSTWLLPYHPHLQSPSASALDSERG